MVEIFQSVKAIHDIFAPILTSAYGDERDLFENVMTTMLEDAHRIAEEYQSVFEMLQDSVPSMRKEIDELIGILVSFQKDNYDSRRDFF